MDDIKPVSLKELKKIEAPTRLYIVYDAMDEYTLEVEAQSHNQARYKATQEFGIEYTSPHISVRLAAKCTCSTCHKEYEGYPGSNRCNQCWNRYFFGT